jgi:hypothetical protein
VVALERFDCGRESQSVGKPSTCEDEK